MRGKEPGLQVSGLANKFLCALCAQWVEAICSEYMHLANTKLLNIRLYLPFCFFYWGQQGNFYLILSSKRCACIPTLTVYVWLMSNIRWLPQKNWLILGFLREIGEIYNNVLFLSGFAKNAPPKKGKVCGRFSISKLSKLLHSNLIC